MTERESDKKDDPDNDAGQLLSSGLKKLSLRPSSEPSAAGVSTNEFYYSMNLPNIETAGEKLNSKKPAAKNVQPPKFKPPVKEESKKSKKELKALLKLENLSLSAKKNQPKPSKATAGPSQEPLKKKSKVAVILPGKVAVNLPPAEKNNLLSKLKLLQSGQMTSVQLEVQNPLPKPKKQKPNIDKEEEMRQNKDEVQRLNFQIQQKIAQAKPKLRHLITKTERHLVNGHGDERRDHAAVESVQSTREGEKHPRIQFRQKPSRQVPVVKTSVKKSDEEEVEIYRYSKDDLNQLQHTATYELVPRLIDLSICALPSDLDALLLKLVSAKNDVERAGLIWLAAEQRLLVRRSTSTDFEYCRVPVIDDAPEDATKKPVNFVMNNLVAIEAIKAVAKTDEGLNEMTYRHEFCNLFEDSLKGQDWKNLPLDQVVQKLIDSNQAYIIEGEIRVNSRNNQEAYVSHPAKKRDICVTKLILRKESFHGDIVKVLVKQTNDGEEADPSAIGVIDEESDALPAENRNFGCVLEILEKRHNRQVIGSLINDKKKEKRNVTFSSRDPKIPFVRVGKEGIPRDTEITDKMLVVVQITSWSYETPKGVIIKIIGNKDKLDSENTAILIQHNLDPQPFAQSIIDQLPIEPFEIPAKEFEYREDLRKKCIFSIDPETARDLDDALSCEELPNGHLEVGVHISDVTYFLKENSELDDLVKEKATTIYLVDQVYHMLPVPLCLLCSLLPGSDKMAYSVIWEMKPDTAEIVSTRFTRSIINSCGKLSYDHAQMVIDKQDSNWSDLEQHFPEIHNGFTVTDIAIVIQKLQKLAVIMRDKRKDNGALKIDQPKISFKFAVDDQRMTAPTSFFQYCIKDSNRLIEEFMLLANISVAKFIYEKFPDVSLLRNHDPPNENGLKKLVANLQKHGVALDTTSSAALSASMEQLIAKAPNWAGMNAALNLMVSRTMQRARYLCSETVQEADGFRHYALSIPMYTHFTSPIRRYADVLVHRVLNAALGYEPAPSRTPDEVHQLANVCNAQKQNAKLAGEDSSNLYFMQFLRSLKKKTMLAAVIGIYDFNLEVVLIETGHVFKVFYKKVTVDGDGRLDVFSDASPPYIVLAKKGCPGVEIKFGSEIKIEVEVSKDKLVAKRIFCK